MKFFQTFILAFLMVSYATSQEPNWSYPLMAAKDAPSGLGEMPSQQSVLITTQSQKKSVGRAFFSSLILPGTGEAYVGRTGYTKIFLTVEAVAWGLLLANHLNVNMQTKDYQNYGVQHAGVNPDGKDKEYWINVGFYNTIYDYNEQKRRERDVDAIYEENAYNAWFWDSESNRQYYAVKRAETREMEGRAVYYVGAIVLNHLVSAINAIRVARHYNKKQELSWNMDCEYDPMLSRLTLSYSKAF
jgi:hypothetical protein